MRYVFTMSFAGSLMLLCVLVASHKRVNLFSYKIQDALLKCSIFYYLVPLVFLEPSYREFVYCLPMELQQDTPKVVEYTYFYSKVGGNLQFNTAYKRQIGLFVIWFVIALLIMLIRIGLYLHRRQRVLKTAVRITKGPDRELLDKIRKEMKIKRKIRLYDTGTAAFTMGVISPVICFDGNVPKEQLEMTFRHECKHIRRLDVLTRQLTNLAVCIHWFNPLVYVLPKKAEWLYEVCCDEAATKGAGQLKRAEYARMIIDNMELKQPAPVLSSALSKDARLTKERIVIIMKPKKRTKLQTALAIMLAGIVFFMDSWTVLAYPKVYEMEFSGIEEFNPDVDIVFVPEGQKGPYDTPEYTILYDNQFVDTEGNIYPVYENGISTCAEHTHRWVEGENQVHEVNASGGCTIYVYITQYCLRCGIVQEKTWTSTSTYVTCPH